VAVGAWHLLAIRPNPHARNMFLDGDVDGPPGWLVAYSGRRYQGLNTLEYQPLKCWPWKVTMIPSPDGAPLILFGLPSARMIRGTIVLEIPKVGSLKKGKKDLAHDLPPPSPVEGFSADKWPPVPVVFWSFSNHCGLRLTSSGSALEACPLARAAGSNDWPWWPGPLCSWAPGSARIVRVGNDRSRPPTVYRLWPASHGDSIHRSQSPAVATSAGVFVVVYFTVFGAGSAATC